MINESVGVLEPSLVDGVVVSSRVGGVEVVGGTAVVRFRTEATAGRGVEVEGCTGLSKASDAEETVGSGVAMGVGGSA